MRVLKGAALGFFGFLLFIAVIVFMVANTVNGTVLSPDFITGEINKIEIGQKLVDYAEDEFTDDDFPPAVRDALFSAIIDTEPIIKEALNGGINSIADYLRGDTDDLALEGVLADTFLNSQFLQSVLDEVDVATLAESAIEDMIPAEYEDAILGALTDNDERIKAQLATASQPVFDYLLSETATIDLMSILRETVLTTDFILPLLDGLDIASISSSFLSDELMAGIPDELSFLGDALDEAVAALEPVIKSAIAGAADQLIDYMTGASSTVRVEVSLASVLDDLEDTMRQAFLDSVPDQWEQLSQSEQDSFLDDLISDAADLIPGSFTIDETMIGSDLPDQIRDGIAEAEKSLGEVRSEIARTLDDVESEMSEPREYIGWFLNGYFGLIALLAVLILAIIGLHHAVKGASRQLGITALICGIIGTAAVIIGDNFFTSGISGLDIPMAMSDLPEILFNDVLAPFRVISYGLVGGGLVLIATSLIYPRLRARADDDAPTPLPPPEEPEPPTEEPEFLAEETELPAEEAETPVEEPEPPAEEPEPLAEEPEPPDEEPEPLAEEPEPPDEESTPSA